MSDESARPQQRGTVWLGTAGWSYLPDWVGPFYPAGTNASNSLQRYVEAFRFVEVDSTFYAAPAPTTIDRWSRIMADGFRVSFKAPKELVQTTRLCPPEIPFGHFCASVQEAFGDRLAMIVVQLQPSFARIPTNSEALRNFVEQWSAEGFPIGIEFRHESWDNDAVRAYLRDHRITMISNDLHDVPDLGPRSFDTSDSAAYIRLIGRHDGMSKDRIQRPQNEARAWWVRQVAAMAERGVRHIYVVANNHYEGHAPQTLRTLRAELEAAGLDVVPSQGYPNGPVSLFGE